MENNKKGLALSGGGYRATLFALGTLWRFNEDGLLTTLDTITCLSGGAIAGAYLHYKWSNLTFECLNEEQKKYRATNFEAEIVKPLLEFCKHGIDYSSIVKGVFNPFSTPAEEVEKKYDEYLFNRAKLSDIPSNELSPEFVIYATNYDTGVSVRITKEYLSDYHLGYGKGHGLSIAKAVSISSAFPPFMSPVTLSSEHWQWELFAEQKESMQTDSALPKEVNSTLPSKDIPLCSGLEVADTKTLKESRKKLNLCDGGLYDNLALEMLWKSGAGSSYETVFSCDAGAPFKVLTGEEKSGLLKRFLKQIKFQNNWFSQLSRMLDVIMNQQTSLRKRGLVRNYKAKEYKGAYWAIKSKTSKYPDIPHSISKEDEKKYMHLHSLSTQLRPFEGTDNLKLVNWGFAQTDLALRGRVYPDLQCRQVPLKD